MNFILTIAGNMAALWLAQMILPGMYITQSSDTSQAVLVYLILGLILTLLNMLVRPIIKFLTFPLYILTFGLFSLVVNAIIIGLTGALSSSLYINGFWTAVFAGLIVSIVASFVTGTLAQVTRTGRRLR